MKVRDISLIALFVTLTVVGSQISIPIGTVPITLQVLMIFLTGYFLKPFQALLTQIIYLLLGIVGLPVFAGFSGGIVHLFGPTGGYLLAFPIAALIVAFSKKDYFSMFLYGIFGLLVIYLLGFSVLAYHLKSFSKAFMVGVLPFIGIDFVKMILAVIISKRVLRVVEV
ncbi:biotin transporter BioY [Thermosipho melanesiensis]|uniref:Biotin transporter n=2 Tax=Thermosipho melanesiensis TaxID=46541 RepID=A6LND1_THEM4|nr:biotin transporter BioY [Thermosipho melanesiensis]ABR31432.1 BioY protein [Thermosipho melanesiensis BI429]APT74491.1 biotin transporter BioY [Thermosipho melanesiensis]OOC36450.1 biotin transporter BioY [Thermosipho melanesiensis]OOC37268.1 biotin transporter BioY [Thermosipho melanesiensis]OOC38020.1 biotin transporter BioY [Thermosipho melanesiensis]